MAKVTLNKIARNSMARERGKVRKRDRPTGTIGCPDYVTERAKVFIRPSISVLNQFLAFADREGIYNNRAFDILIEAGLRALDQWISKDKMRDML